MATITSFCAGAAPTKKRSPVVCQMWTNAPPRLLTALTMHCALTPMAHMYVRAEGASKQVEKNVWVRTILPAAVGIRSPQHFFFILILLIFHDVELIALFQSPAEIDECVGQSDFCDSFLARCINTEGSYLCECLDGFQGSGFEGDCRREANYPYMGECAPLTQPHRGNFGI